MSYELSTTDVDLAKSEAYKDGVAAGRNIREQEIIIFLQEMAQHYDELEQPLASSALITAVLNIRKIRVEQGE